MELGQWLSIASAVLYYTVYPVYYLATWLFYVLYWIASPFLWIGFFIKELLMLPVNFLAKFEALWYFLGAAVLVGGFFGLGLHLVMRGVTSVLKLDQPKVPEETPATGHDAQSYRAARQEKKRKEVAKQQKQATQARLLASQPLLQEAVREARGHIPVPLPASSDSNPLSPGTQRPALLRETILEHTDEEDEDFDF